MGTVDLHKKYDIYKSVLFCTDFSPNAHFAFDFALAAASHHPNAILHVLHVIPEPEAQFWKTYIYEVDDVDRKARHDIDEKLQNEYLPRVPASLNVQVAMRIGKDWSEILCLADEIAADLIVMGRQGHSAMETVFFGNVTERVVRKARCPVLVVPMCFSPDAS